VGGGQGAGGGGAGGEAAGEGGYAFGGGAVGGAFGVTVRVRGAREAVYEGVFLVGDVAEQGGGEIGRASCRERV